ncbi:cilia- and flagella-associated protein 57-like [Hemibagrus wyckioides]|uniref:cilia- and flagella-associated protein 57-like n=1 Tax=Hemibagrus wyckioides TaxID=337641 RepID=UPI00266CEA4F|nr:cilia- and flagella-associated protein 57-like [Hemibagrus wyckioides]
MLCPQEKEGIQVLAISPDRRYLAVSESGVQGISVYDLQSEQCTRVKVLMAQGFGVLQFVCMAFSADSKYLLCQSGGPEWTLFYWDWKKDEVIAIVNTTRVGIVSQVSFNPVDNTRICVSGNHVFKIFQLEKDCLKKISTFKMDSENIKSHAWLSEDSIVLGTERGKLLLLKDGELHKLPRPFERVKSNSSSTAALPHITAIRAYSKGFACAGNLGEVCLYEKTEEYGYMKATEIRIPQDPCSSEPQEVIEMCLSPSEETLAISTHRGLIYHVNLASVELSQSKQANFEHLFNSLHLGSITGLSVCDSKTLFATCSKDNTVRIWNYKTNSLELQRKFPEEPTCISLHPNGLSILVGFSTKVCLMNLLVDRFHTVQEFDIQGCSECVFNHGGSMFATVSENLISIVNIRTGKIMKLNGQISKVQSVTWCTNDLHLVSCGMDGSICEWNVLTGARSENKKKMCSYMDVTLSDSSESIFFVGGSMLYEFRDGEVVREVASTDTAFTAVAMTHSSQAVFVGTAAGTIRVMQYPLEEETSWTEHQAHSGPITKMIVTPDDQYLVTASEDGSLLMWSITDQNGCKLSMEKEICFSEDVLCSQAFLKRKDRSILEVQSQMESQKERLKYKLKQTHMDYEKKLDKDQESYRQQIESLKDQIQTLNSEKEEEKISHEKALAEMRENHAKELKEQTLNTKLNKAFTVQAEIRLNYDQRLFDQVDNHFRTTMDMKRAYEQRIQEQQDQMHCCEEKLKELQEKFDSEFKDDFLQHAQELQAEKEMNKTLQDEKKLMEKQLMLLWKVKGENQDQCLEISQLEAKVEEINVKNKKAIKELQQKIKKQEEELCTERKKVRNMKTYVQKMKADIKNCSSFVNQPHQLRKNFTSLYKSYINDVDVTARVKPGVRQREQQQRTAASSAQNQAVEPKTQESDCCEILKQQTEVHQEVNNSEETLTAMHTNHTAELEEILLKYEQELQAEKETCSQLKYEMKLMEQQMVQFWKIKEEIEDQNLEINMLKEEVQSLHGQHKIFKKVRKEQKSEQKPDQDKNIHLQDIVQMYEKSKKQKKSDLISINNQLDGLIKDRTRQTDETDLEEVKNKIDEKKLFVKKLGAEVTEMNTKYQQTIDELKEKLKVTEMELCKERERARNTKLMLDRIKADIHTCSNFIQQPRMLKENFIKLHKEYINDGERRALPRIDKDHRDRTRESRTTKVNARVSTARDPPKTGRCPVTLPPLLTRRRQNPSFLKEIQAFHRKL